MSLPWLLALLSVLVPVARDPEYWVRRRGAGLEVHSHGHVFLYRDDGLILDLSGATP